MNYLNFKILEQREVPVSGFCEEVFFGNKEDDKKCENLLCIEFFNENEYWIGKFPVGEDIFCNIFNKIKVIDFIAFVLAGGRFFLVDLEKRKKILELPIIPFSYWEDFEIISEKNEVILTNGEKLFIFDIKGKKIVWESYQVSCGIMIFTKKENNKIKGLLKTSYHDNKKPECEFEFDFINRKFISDYDYYE